MSPYQFAHCMNIGLRKHQEDCLFLNGEVVQESLSTGFTPTEAPGGSALFAVCDGMGGHNSGDWASKYVCGKIREHFKNFMLSENFIENFFRTVQSQMEQEATSNSGTTVAGVFLKGRESMVFNAGDSRVYKVTGNSISYVSHDHSLAQNNVDSGHLSQEEAFSFPFRNIIDFGIGDTFKSEWAANGKRMYFLKDSLEEGEYYLVCTDGVNDILREDEIQSSLAGKPVERARALAEKVENRMNDNFSFVIVGNGL